MFSLCFFYSLFFLTVLELVIPSHGADANQQKLVTVRYYTENYRQSYSIRTVKDWNILPQSVMSAAF